MNLGFKKSIDLYVFKKILEIKSKRSKGYVTINVESKIDRDFKIHLRKEGVLISENKLRIISNNLFQYKFEWH